MSRIVIFVGPSLFGLDTKLYCPTAEFRPPIKRGDLDDFVASDCVGIIDGVFGQTLAISPREIHQALERGVRIWGSSSMGALRASEVPEMKGIGRIYEWYRDGVINSDDEVALIFDPETYRNMSFPLVNLRYSIEQLELVGSISTELGARLLLTACSFPYTKRRVIDIVRAAGVNDEHSSKNLCTLIANYDLKREDALLLFDKFQHIEQLKSIPISSVESDSTEFCLKTDTFPNLPANTPYIWEYGDYLTFNEVVNFLKCTGRFLESARYAALHILFTRPKFIEELSADPTAQFHKIRLTWGWLAAQETRVTLNDLGVDANLLNSTLGLESKVQSAIRCLASTNDREFLDILRVELFQNDLCLKRAGLKIGALKWLASRARTRGFEISESGFIDARARLRRAMTVWSDEEVNTELTSLGMTTEQVVEVIEHIALARLLMDDLLSVSKLNYKKELIKQDQLSEKFNNFLPSLHRRLKASDSKKYHLSSVDGALIAEKIAPQIGVTRIGFIGELDDSGVIISQTFRPSSTWSTTTSSGKGGTRASAVIGGVLEEAERFAQERFSPSKEENLFGSFSELQKLGVSIVDPLDLDLPADTVYRQDQPIEWIPCFDLVSKQEIYAPTSLFVHNKLDNDIYFSERAGRKIFTTNGLASGFCAEEVLIHAICEIVERHATRLAELKTENPGLELYRPHFVDIFTLPPIIRQDVDRLIAAGYEIRLQNITSEILIPTFDARLFRLDDGVKSIVGFGWGAHPDPEVALQMAIFEAAQGRAVQIGGSREDLDLYSRSLGRHERPRTARPSAIALHYGVSPTAHPFNTEDGFRTRDLQQELDWVVEKVVEAGFKQILVREISCQEVNPAMVIRAVIPGVETANPFYTGPRARLLALADLIDPPLWFCGSKY
jgi:uncharacterized domain